jgi:hypothetical protein
VSCKEEALEKPYPLCELQLEGFLAEGYSIAAQENFTMSNPSRVYLKLGLQYIDDK